MGEEAQGWDSTRPQDPIPVCRGQNRVVLSPPTEDQSWNAGTRWDGAGSPGIKSQHAGSRMRQHWVTGIPSQCAGQGGGSDGLRCSIWPTDQPRTTHLAHRAKRLIEHHGSSCLKQAHLNFYFQYIIPLFVPYGQLRK